MNEDSSMYVGGELDAMSAAVNYHRWIVTLLAPYLGRRVAEVGAGIGSVSKLLLERPAIQLTAFEPAENLFPRLQAALRGDARAKPVRCLLRDRDAGEQFDSIVYVNVLEHIRDDHGELRIAYQALNPGGHVLLFVPAFPWLYGELDRQFAHWRRYRARNLARLAVDAGFEIQSVRYVDIAGVLPWLVMGRLFRVPPTRSSVALYDKIVVPAMRIVEGILPPPIGKNLFVAARRTG